MKKIDFLAIDGVKLNGIMYETQEKTKDAMIAVHGMVSNCFKQRDEVIANKANEVGIDYFCFNNRGSEIVKYLKIDREEPEELKLGGTAYEDVLEGYEDIVGAILKLKELGYQNIYLQGHSLGCTKIVYTYNKLKNENSQHILENIKGIILLSLVDIPGTLRVFLGDKLNSYLKLAEEKERERKELELMPKESFIHPVSVKTFLRYARDNQEIDFAQYGEDRELKKLNNITIPLFMRWGNVNEMMIQDVEDVVTLLNDRITNRNKNIAYMEGANHSYKGKESILAEQIIKFIKQIT